jgi:hypothetical protein
VTLEEMPSDSMTSAAEFPAEDDLFVVGENIERLVLADADSNPLAVGVRGLQLPLARADVTSSGGAFQITDVWWHLCANDCAVPPDINFYVLQSGGVRWQIIAAPSNRTCHSRWKCACRLA